MCSLDILNCSLLLNVQALSPPSFFAIVVLIQVCQSRRLVFHFPISHELACNIMDSSSDEESILRDMYDIFRPKKAPSHGINRSDYSSCLGMLSIDKNMTAARCFNAMHCYFISELTKFCVRLVFVRKILVGNVLSSQWACETCTYLNAPSARVCSMCGAERAATVPTAPFKHPTPAPLAPSNPYRCMSIFTLF